MNIEIANRMVLLRKQSGLSQEELAAKLGISRQAVSKWERAESSPDTDNLILLARLYHVSLDDLLQTEDPVEARPAEGEPDGIHLELPKDPAEAPAQEQETPAQAAAPSAQEPAPSSSGPVLEMPTAESISEAAQRLADHASKAAREAVNYVTNKDWAKKEENQEENSSWEPQTSGTAYPPQSYGAVGGDRPRGRMSNTLIGVGIVAAIVCVGLWVVFHLGGLLSLAVVILLPILGRTFHWIAIYPIVCTIVFLSMGFFLSIWHPSWMVFLTIPIFYVMESNKKPGSAE